MEHRHAQLDEVHWNEHAEHVHDRAHEHEEEDEAKQRANRAAFGRGARQTVPELLEVPISTDAAENTGVAACTRGSRCVRACKTRLRVQTLVEGVALRAVGDPVPWLCRDHAGGCDVSHTTVAAGRARLTRQTVVSSYHRKLCGSAPLVRPGHSLHSGCGASDVSKHLQQVAARRRQKHREVTACAGTTAVGARRAKGCSLCVCAEGQLDGEGGCFSDGPAGGIPVRLQVEPWR